MGKEENVERELRCRKADIMIQPPTANHDLHAQNDNFRPPPSALAPLYEH